MSHGKTFSGMPAQHTWRLMLTISLLCSKSVLVHILPHTTFTAFNARALCLPDLLPAFTYEHAALFLSQPESIRYTSYFMLRFSDVDIRYSCRGISSRVFQLITQPSQNHSPCHQRMCLLCLDQKLLGRALPCG